MASLVHDEDELGFPSQDSTAEFRNGNQKSTVTPEERQCMDSVAALLAKEDNQDSLFTEYGALLRYTRARKCDARAAAKLLKETAEWRQRFEFDALIRGELASVIAEENATGKGYVRGFDKCGRPVIYMRSRLENTNDHEGNLRHLVYNLERAIAVAEAKGKGVEKVCLVIDFNGFSLMKQPPMKTSRATLDILQNHYPERLGVCFCIDPPWVFQGFWNLISPFIDPVTRDKIKFVSRDSGRTLLEENFDMDELEANVHGRNEVAFSSSVYLDGRMDEDYNAVLLRGK